MRAVVQRVSSARVVCDAEVAGEIGSGLLVYLGIGADDTDKHVSYMVNKIRHLRVFEDDQGKMNLDVLQVGGGCLVVSAFSTLGDARKGHRPAYVAAAAPERANELYCAVCDQLAESGVPVATGRFRQTMSVDSVNAGPICILIDSDKVF